MKDLKKLTASELTHVVEGLQLIKAEKEKTEAYPSWFDGKIVDEVAYCEALLERQELKCISGKLYSINGYLDDDEMRAKIVQDLSGYVRTNLYRKAGQILDTLKALCYSPAIAPSANQIHFQNGTYHLQYGFTDNLEWTMNRLPVSYDPNAKEPVRWLQFMQELVHETDIATVQEFLGYTMVATNKGQAMLLIIGKGGEGKSRISAIMQEIMGTNMNIGKISDLESNRFALGSLEGKLLLIDDDMKMEALASTDALKAIVTCEGMMDIEIKQKQSHQGLMYASLIGLGNGTLKSLHDKSMGFYRRQLIIETKDKPADRMDDPYLLEKLRGEIPGIVLWCLEGLKRLVANDYRFTVSEHSQKLKNELIEEDNNIRAFLNSTGYIRFNKNTRCTTNRLFDAYCQWCEENAEKHVAITTFAKYLKQHAEQLGIKYVKNIPLAMSRYQRGYEGLEVLVNGFAQVLPEERVKVPFNDSNPS